MNPISKATPDDIPGLLKLINSGYRGEASKAGWTTEADLLRGPQRIDEAGLSELFFRSDATFYKYTNEEGLIVGCVFLEKRKENKLYLGLLTVAPNLQGCGIGKKLLAVANEHARLHQCRAIYMTVFTARPELIQWYERHGFHTTGERIPYTEDHKYGVPAQALEFLVLEKNMAVQ